MAKQKKKYYSLAEKRAYYAGFGCGSAGQLINEKNVNMVELMTESERDSFMNGIIAGTDSKSIKANKRLNKTWFW